MKIILLCVVSSYVLYGAESYTMPDPLTNQGAKDALQHLNGGNVPTFNNVAGFSLPSGFSTKIIEADLIAMNNNESDDPLTVAQIRRLFDYMRNRAQLFIEVTVADWDIIYA